MNTSMILAFIAMGSAVVSLSLAVYSLWCLGRTSNNRLKLRLDDQEAYLDRLTQWYKKLNMNYARLSRESSGTQTQNDVPANADGAFAMKPGETPEQWKHRMRMELAAGNFRHK